MINENFMDLQRVFLGICMISCREHKQIFFFELHILLYAFHFNSFDISSIISSNI